MPKQFTTFYNHAYCYSQERICGYSRNQLKAIKLWHLAGDSGCTIAYSSIAIAFCNGEGVAKNEEIAKKYWEQAAIRGACYSRYNLGLKEEFVGI